MTGLLSAASAVWRRMLGRPAAGSDREPARLGSGGRIYAIGDVHGRDDLLDDLLGLIETDRRERPAAATRLLFLGDYIDRGPGSAKVIERLIELEGDAVFLMGNHEELLLRAASGDHRAATIFARVGGVETMASYGADAAIFAAAEADDQIRMINAAVPRRHIEWIGALPSSYVDGDYMFVHAGVMPGVPIEEQPPEILRWIRGDFLESRKDHGKMIVHGHSVLAAIDERSNRIGIDTGAYFSGILTAVAVEEDRRWYLQTGGGEGAASEA